MARHRIFTVGFDLPGGDFEFVAFDSDRTLLDADIVLFEPSLGHAYGPESYNGKTLLSEQSSFAANEKLKHWNRELVAAFNAGKLVIIFLNKPIEYFRYTGEKKFSGTGRSQKTTAIVTAISSYDAIPSLDSVAATSGTEIRLERDAAFLAPYWQEFSAICPYQVTITGKFSKALLTSSSGHRIVGAAIFGKSGTLMYLPPLGFDPEGYTSFNKKDGENHWNQKGIQFGKRLAATIGPLCDALKNSRTSTPPPGWTEHTSYRLAQEARVESELAKAAQELAKLQGAKTKLERDLRDAGRLRGLLFEQGKILEGCVLDALRLFGFSAEPHTDGKSEFDAVFSSPEGRCLGEVEGKDGKAVNIDKISQLERNIHEDYDRDDVSDFAKGVLFGNAFRLSPMAERADFFTEKCYSAAVRTKIALVRTPDLFPPAKYLQERPEETDYAKQCREAIFRAEGTVVVFPNPPSAGAIEIKGPTGT